MTTGLIALKENEDYQLPLAITVKWRFCFQRDYTSEYLGGKGWRPQDRALVFLLWLTTIGMRVLDWRCLWADPAKFCLWFNVSMISEILTTTQQGRSAFQLSYCGSRNRLKGACIASLSKFTMTTNSKEKLSGRATLERKLQQG